MGYSTIGARKTVRKKGPEKGSGETIVFPEKGFVFLGKRIGETIVFPEKGFVFPEKGYGKQ